MSWKQLSEDHDILDELAGERNRRHVLDIWSNGQPILADLREHRDDRNRDLSLNLLH